jgi:dimethylamine monooxygenase subunit A
MYVVNIEPHVPGAKGTVYEFPIDIDEHYLSDMADRALVLKEDPLRCQSLPHMLTAEWDLVELLMTSMSHDYPEHFTLHRDGDNWHWINRPMNIDQKFIFGDVSTLPYRPMEYITRQCQGDFCLLDQRDGNLWMDSGIVSSQADWSLDFDIGMNFMEWHAPVPMAHEAGVFDRALKFMLNLQQGRPVRRLNWTMTINPRLDTSPENYHKWGTDRTTVTPENVGDKVHLRVELQGLWPPTTLERHCVFNPRLHDQNAGTCDGSEMGPPSASRSQNPAATDRRLQRPDALPPEYHRLAGKVRRRRVHFARLQPGIADA